MARRSRIPEALKGLGTLVVISGVIIVLALLFFMVTAWIVDFGVEQVSGQAPTPDFTALSAAILTFGGLAGSIMRGIASAFTGGREPEQEESYDVSEVA